MDQTEKLRGRLYEPVGCVGIERAALLGTGRRLGDRYRVQAEGSSKAVGRFLTSATKRSRAGRVTGVGMLEIVPTRE